MYMDTGKNTEYGMHPKECIMHTIHTAYLGANSFMVHSPPDTSFSHLAPIHSEVNFSIYMKTCVSIANNWHYCLP